MGKSHGGFNYLSLGGLWRKISYQSDVRGPAISRVGQEVELGLTPNGLACMLSLNSQKKLDSRG